MPTIKFVSKLTKFFQKAIPHLKTNAWWKTCTHSSNVHHLICIVSCKWSFHFCRQVYCFLLLLLLLFPVEQTISLNCTTCQLLMVSMWFSWFPWAPSWIFSQPLLLISIESVIFTIEVFSKIGKPHYFNEVTHTNVGHPVSRWIWYIYKSDRYMFVSYICFCKCALR